MKQSLYDIFDHFTPEDNTLPHLKEQPMNEKAISDQVFSKIGYHPIVKTKKKKSYRLFGIAAAVAILACGTITTAAVTGNMDLFFSTVSSSNLSDSGINPPGVSSSIPDSIAQMQAYYRCPDVTFTATDQATVSLLGFYHDHNTLMLSVQLTVKDDTALTESMGLLPYFTLKTADGTEKNLVNSGALSSYLQKSKTADHVYYATYYLVDSDFSNSTLQVSFTGVYDKEQEQQVQNEIVDLQDHWRTAYSSETTPVEEWKDYWQTHHLDEKTRAARKAAFEKLPAVLDGTWSAEIPIDSIDTTVINAESEGIAISMDELSLSVSQIPETIQQLGAVSPVVYLKDGTILSDDFFMFPDLPKNQDGSALLTDTPYQQFAFVQGTGTGEDKKTIYCYNQPIDPASIEKVEIYVQYYDADWNKQTDCYSVYSAQ